MISNALADVPLTRDAAALVNRAREIAARRGNSEATANDLLGAVQEMHPELVPKPVSAAGDTDALSLNRVLINANREAQSLGHFQVGPTHLLLALLYSDSPSTSAPLQQAGLTLYDVRQRLQGAVATGDAAYKRRLPSLRGVFTISPVFLGLMGVAAASGALLWTDLLPGLAVPLTLTFVVAGWIISLCVHEFGHALVAYLGGDRAVVAAGYLTLNPLRYTNATLSVVLPVVFLLLGGVALPGGAVYVNHSALRSKAWSSAVSIAGPFGTFVCWLIIAVAFNLTAGLMSNTNLFFFAALAALGFYMTFAVLLNLLPVPGLDGFGIIRPWLPYSWQYSAVRYGTLAILGVFAVLWFVAPVRNAFYELIFHITALANIPTDLIFLGLLHMRIF